MITDNQGHNATFDAEGRVITANGETYGYDGDGNRVLKKDSSGLNGSTYWYGADGSLTDEQSLQLNGNNPAKLIRNIYLAGKLTVRIGFDESFWPSLIILPDQIGSTRVTVGLTTSAECPSTDHVCTEEFLPFGAWVSQPSTNLEQQFTGKIRDPETGNDYFGARYYNSSLGRFLSPDWAAQEEPVPYAQMEDPQSLNLYAYVRNNPLARIDPDGHAGCSDTPTLCAAVRDAVSVGGSIQDGWNKVVGELRGALQRIAQAQQNADPNQPTIQGVAASGTYGSKKAAALAAEKSGLGSTRSAAKGGKIEEWGGWVISKGGKYTYTNPVTFGDPQHFYVDNVTVPSGYTAVGGYHTHPDPGSWGEGFSDRDMNWAINHNMTSYVGMSYSGNVRSYTPGVTQYGGYGVTGDLIGNVP